MSLARRTLILACSLWVGVQGGLGTLVAQANPVTIVTEEWAPYNYTENGVLKGLAVELVLALSKELGLTPNIGVYPSMRASQMVNENPRTMLITMLRTPARENQYQWIGPLGDGAIYLYMRKGNPLTISNLSEAKTVGLIACRTAGLVVNTLRAAGFTNLDATSPDGASVYKKVLSGRADLGVSDAPLGVQYLLAQMNLPSDALVRVPVIVVEAPLYIAASKDIPAGEIALWAKALERIKASGVYSAIHKKYGG